MVVVATSKSASPPNSIVNSNSPTLELGVLQMLTRIMRILSKWSACSSAPKSGHERKRASLTDPYCTLRKSVCTVASRRLCDSKASTALYKDSARATSSESVRDADCRDAPGRALWL